MKNYLIDRYCTIGEMSKFLKINKHTILHYEDLNLISPVRRGSNNYRYYSGGQIERFKHILYLRELGFSIKDIKECLDSQEKTKFFIEKNLSEVDKEIEKLIQKKISLEKFNKQIDIIEKRKNKLNIPFLEELEEVETIFTEQNSFDLEANINSFNIFDNLLNETTWSEKNLFGLLISKDNLLNDNYYPTKFIVQNKLESYNKKYIFKKGIYALLYTSTETSNENSIKKILDWISENSYTIQGDLLIQYNSALSFFQSDKNSAGIKTLKICIKKS